MLLSWFSSDNCGVWIPPPPPSSPALSQISELPSSSSFPQVFSNKHLSKQEQIWYRGEHPPYASIHHFNEWRCVQAPQ